MLKQIAFLMLAGCLLSGCVAPSETIIVRRPHHYYPYYPHHYWHHYHHHHCPWGASNCLDS